MAYNPYFPQTYQPYQPQVMTPPTIRADIVQVENEQAAENYPLSSGSQMMISRDESAIFVKSITPTGVRLDVFVKRPPTPQKPSFDPAAYVTKDELEARVAALIAEIGGKE